MKNYLFVVPLAVFITSYSALSFANPDNPIPRLETIHVTGYAGSAETNAKLSSQSPINKPMHDAGELLRSVNGVSATRRGGRGFDPIIRGQSQNQLNILTDGSYTFGACPSRMDPPSSYTALDNFDEVTVIKGKRSVIYGAGGSGGTLLFQHKRPDFTQKNVSGYITSAYTGNSDLKNSSANIAIGDTKKFVRVFGNIKSSDNYQDGDGVTTSSAFESSSYGIITGADVGENDYLEYSYEEVNEDDTWFSGSGMDSPYTDSKTHRLKWKHHKPIGFIDSTVLNVYSSDVGHLMDNYTVRNRNPAPNGMAAPSTSDTIGGRWLASVEKENSQWRFGLDYRANNRDAELWMDMGKNGVYNTLLANLWPGIKQSITGAFVELDYALNESDILRVGTRFDHFTSDATQAADTAITDANTLYSTYYNTTAHKRSENDLSFILGWDHPLNNEKVFSVNFSRTVRHPDATEQYIARRAMGVDWVGNPNIDSEQHHQIDITLAHQAQDTRWSSTVFWDEVNDYIDRYNSGAHSLYRNVDATLRGVELDVSQQLSNEWSVTAALSYTDGEDSYGNLPQISPLETRLQIQYKKSRWSAGAELIAADDQEQWDPDNDASQTSGFSLINLFSNYQLSKNFNIEAGVENLFDKAYAYHVNKSGNNDPFNPTPTQVQEPGRQLWVKARYQF